LRGNSFIKCFLGPLLIIPTELSSRLTRGREILQLWKLCFLQSIVQFLHNILQYYAFSL
jgi:hypothetical protein